MGQNILEIENLSKLYRLGEVGTGTLSQDLNRWWAKSRGKEDPYSKVGQLNDRSGNAKSDFVWALKDINLSMKPGEVLGIIGKNGAGKSTLLKLISRITAPTTGEIRAKGRIASLLEVGTGMNQEMTARENIFLNGAILGMSKIEIRKKFDDIIDFAGCAMYVDTPIKRFSSGMRVRLGFAVAAFLEPEILIVDEVLAVGDAEFQKRAVGKIKDVSNSEGRTVMFVSHNMSSVKNICDRGIVLKQGEHIYSGTANEAVDFYMSEYSDLATADLALREDRKGGTHFRFSQLSIVDKNGTQTSEAISGESLTLKIDYKKLKNLRLDQGFISTVILDKYENIVAVFRSDEMGFTLKDNSPAGSMGSFKLEIPRLYLRAEEYYIRLIAHESRPRPDNILDYIDNAFQLNITAGDLWEIGSPNKPGNSSIFPANYSTV
jgi:lipopolysaccharide transport system ATP-binding protein